MNKKKLPKPEISNNGFKISGAEKFFSLKWKAIILTSIVLTIVNISLSSISYLNLVRQFDNQKRKAIHRYTIEIEALIEQSLRHMQQVAHIIPILSTTESSDISINRKNIIKTLKKHWPSLQLNMGINAVRFYSPENQLLVNWEESGFKKDNAPNISSWINEVNRLEKPTTLIDCQKECVQYAAVPVLSREKKTGVILVESSLADVVLGFKQISGIDMGIIISNEGQKTGVDEDRKKIENNFGKYLLPWKASVIALTDIGHKLPILQKLAAEHPLLTQMKSGIQVLDNKRYFEVHLIPLKDFNVNLVGSGFLVLITDITRSLFEIKSSLKQTVWICIIGIFFSEILLLLLLWKPLSRLRHMAKYLPLLAEGGFVKARCAIRKEYIHPQRKDEVDVLTETAIKLSYRLEGLSETISKNIDDLSRERDFVKSLLDTAPVIILIQNRSGEITLLNHYGRSLAMYEKNNPEQLRFTDFLSADKQSNDFHKDMMQIFAGKLHQVSSESIMTCKDGSTKYIAWTHCPLSEKSINEPLILSVGLDITKRKTAEEELRKSNEHLQAVFRAADSVSFITTDSVGKDLRIIESSPGTGQIFGYSQKDATGKPVAMLYLQEDAGLIARTCQAMWKKKKGVTLQLDMVRKSGESFPALLTIYPILDLNGNIVMILWVSFDISEIKDIHKEKERLESQLRHSQKMEAVGTLAGGIAHDFNNILQVISGYTQLLLFKKQKDDPDYSKLETIGNSVERASALTKQLLIFSRKVDSELKPVDLNRGAREIYDILKRTFPKMLEIELDLDENLKVINADPLQLEQVMMNLAINARDAMDNKGKLKFKTRNVVINHKLIEANANINPGEYVELSVSDSGAGIPEDIMEHIFEPFFTTKETGKGTGLGLAIVYGIVKSHGGEIICHSKPGKGTAFCIYFPVLKSETKDLSENKKLVKSTAGGNETILLVDDEKTILEIGKNILSRFGYKVLTAENGEKAVDIYSKNKKMINMVILDLNMPGMGGLKSFEKLKEIDPEVKVIIATGYSDSKNEIESNKYFNKNIIKKPFPLSDLLEKVREVLDN